uniref:Peptidase S8/S53 domain-containing protein n=1 Tax=Panagrolaimus sp. ES5 TaxID=591445 RepID=A0AC34GSZ1_9BILA
MSAVSAFLNYISKDFSQQKLFLSKYPEFDGRGIKIAVIDGAVDLSLVGLQKTSNGLPKIIDCFDFSGAGDVDTSIIREMDDERCLIGLSGRKFKIPLKWKNPSQKWHLGLKSLLKPMTKLNEKLPEIDCIVWFNGKKWVACIDTLKDGLENAKVLTNFRDKHEYDILLFSQLELELCYCITINNEGNLLQIYTPYDEHASFVIQVAAAYFPDKSDDQNGLAPGAQIISMNIMNADDDLFISALKQAVSFKHVYLSLIKTLSF